ncbi:MAG: ribosome silencing factor [Verrucomicrobia bacterium]|nr:MAG: ribosome silencing factor [Verrucomicrobiota bacterium]
MTAKQLATTCAELASNKKAEDAGEIETRLKQDHGLRAAAVDGFPASQWIVLDYLEVVIHIFHRDKRAFYSLEDLWGDAPRVEWEASATAS